MITESQHLLVDVKNKLDRILYLERGKKPNVLDGEAPKLPKIGDQIVVAHNVLDEINRNLK